MKRKRLVLDANILLRAVFGKRVRALLTTYGGRASFYTPDICLVEARKYIPSISARENLDANDNFLALDELVLLLEVTDLKEYEAHELSARQRMASRDLADWPIAATALLLDCPIWTEDQDFFGAGIATWTTANVELYLRDA
jgi:predicted nucleic acid-binding protein